MYNIKYSIYPIDFINYTNNNHVISFIFLMTLRNSSKVTLPLYLRSAALIISCKVLSETYSPISRATFFNLKKSIVPDPSSSKI